MSHCHWHSLRAHRYHWHRFEISGVMVVRWNDSPAQVEEVVSGVCMQDIWMWSLVGRYGSRAVRLWWSYLLVRLGSLSRLCSFSRSLPLSSHQRSIAKTSRKEGRSKWSVTSTKYYCGITYAGLWQLIGFIPPQLRCYHYKVFWQREVYRWWDGYCFYCQQNFALEAA